jgi:predicted transcriptional regulator
VTSIKKLMHKHVCAVCKNTTIGSALMLMKRAHISVVPVLESGELIGVLTVGEIEKEPPDKKVGDLNLRTLFVEVNDKMEKAAKVMVENKICRLPVVNCASDMKCVGIVNATEIVRKHKNNKKIKK